MRYRYAAGIFAAAFTVYIITSSPGLSWAFGSTDGGELATAAVLGGIAHPSGYPLYVIFGHIFTNILPWRAALDLTVLAALSMAGGLTFLSLAIFKLVPDVQPGVVVAGMLWLGFSGLFWSQAVVIEVYSLTFALFGLLFWLLSMQPHPVIGCIAGISLGNHLILALALPGLLIWKPPRRFLLFSALFIIGLGIYLFLPLRAGAEPASNWGNPNTFDRLRAHISAEIYQEFIFAADFGDQSQDVLELTLATLLIWSPSVLVGIWHLRQTQFNFLVGTMITASGLWIYRVGYAANDVDGYLLIPLALLMVYAIIGTDYLLRHRQQVAWALLILPALLLGINYSDYNLRHDNTVEAFINQTLDAVPPDAVILSDTERESFALFYAVYAEKRRPDVTVIDVRMLQWEWYIENITALEPVLLDKLPPTFATVPMVMSAFEERPVYSLYPVPEDLAEEYDVYYLGAE